MSTELLLALILLTVAAPVLLVGAWLLRQLRRQQCEIERRLARLERGIGQRARTGGPPDPMRGLPTGSMLNDFELARREGRGTLRLSDVRGQRAAFIFIDPGCAGSRALARALADASPDPPPVLVTNEPADGAWLDGLASEIPVVVQRRSELARVWLVTLTPAAYLVDRDGLTEAPMVRGARSIAAALGLPSLDGLDDSTTPLPRAFGEVPRAPEVGARLDPIVRTTIDGERVELTAGHPGGTLLVFTDPACVACAGLPAVLASTRFRGRIIVIVRGDVAAADAMRGSVPAGTVLLADRLGEIGRAAGVVATPSALCLSADGSVLAPVATGSPAIGRLLNAAADSLVQVVP